MDIIGGLIIIAAVLNLFSGIIIFFYGKRNIENLSFGIIIFSVFAWAISIFFFRIATVDNIDFFVRFLYSIPLLIVISFLTFAIVFPHRVFQRWRWLIAGFFACAITFVYLVFFSQHIIVETSIKQGAENIIIFGSLYFLYSTFIFLTFTVAYIIFFYKLFHVSQRNRKLLILIIIGTGIPVIIALITNLILPFFGIFSLNWLGQVVTIFMSLTVAFAIAKYNLFNIKLFTTQLFVFGLDLAIFLEIFSASTKRELYVRIFFFVVIAFFLQMLLRSVRQEIGQKEELTKLTEKLERANNELQRLDNAKSEFISIASHQLRTPLTAIKGYISLIQEGSYGTISKDVSMALNKVYRSNERLIQLVEDLLNISRIESGRMEFKFEPVNVSDVVNSLYDTFILRAKEKNLTFTINTPQNERDAIVEGDLSKLREVISNLIDNAIKYTEKGFVNVTVARHRDVVRVIVEDSGIGIPKKVSSQLFKKFSRGKDTSRLHVEGTGLGLYVGKNIIEAHHGNIMVESDGKGKGSRFILEIPRKQSLH